MNAFANLLLTVIVIQIIIFAILDMVLRWIFRINRIVALLESIDESLRQLPVVRRYDHMGQRTKNV